MGQKIQLSESQLRKLIKESVMKSINEVSDRTIANAAMRSDDLIRYLEAIKKHFNELINDFEYLESYDGERFYTSNREMKEISYELRKLADKFNDFYNRKENQNGKFQGEYAERGYPDVD